MRENYFNLIRGTTTYLSRKQISHTETQRITHIALRDKQVVGFRKKIKKQTLFISALTYNIYHNIISILFIKKSAQSYVFFITSIFY